MNTRVGSHFFKTEVLQQVQPPSATKGNRRQPTTNAKPNLKATDPHHCATKRAATQPIGETSWGHNVLKPKVFQQVPSSSATKGKLNLKVTGRPPLCDEKGGTTASR